jgi:hypothetical protein
MGMFLNSESQIEKNKLIIQAFVKVINAQNWRALDELTASNFVRHSDAGGQPGVQSRSDLVSFLRSEYPNPYLLLLAGYGARQFDQLPDRAPGAGK